MRMNLILRDIIAWVLLLRLFKEKQETIDKMRRYCSTSFCLTIVFLKKKKKNEPMNRLVSERIIFPFPVACTRCRPRGAGTTLVSDVSDQGNDR
jgi:hypothetical protein